MTSDYARLYPGDYSWLGGGATRKVEVPFTPFGGVTYTSAEVGTLVANANKAGREQEAARINEAKDAWIIISRFGGNLMPSVNPRVYVSKKQALTVAEKLAKDTPGTDFIVLRMMEVVRATAPATTVNHI